MKKYYSIANGTLLYIHNGCLLFLCWNADDGTQYINIKEIKMKKYIKNKSIKE